MGDCDSCPMLYCSGVFSHKNSICFRGLGNSRMFAHDSAAAVLLICKKQQQQQQNGGMTAVFYCYSLVG